MSEQAEMAVKKSREDLARAFQGFHLRELRWDWGCNVSLDTKGLIGAEVARRGIDMQRFRLVKGVRKEY